MAEGPDFNKKICTAIIEAVDSRLDLLSYAATGSLDSLARKLFAKRLIPETAKDDPAKSFDSLWRSFKGNIKLEQSSSNLNKKVKEFVTALEEIGGGLEAAASSIREDINKKMGGASPFASSTQQAATTPGRAPNGVPQSTSDSAPTIGQLVKCTKTECNKWFEIGVHLNVPGHELDAIETKKRDPVDRLIQVYMYWQKNAKPRTNPFTWKTIAVVIREIGNNSLADEIESN